MEKAKVSVENLTYLKSTLETNLDNIQTIKNSMDNALKSFIWEDPVGNAFRAKYYEDLEPIEGELIPNLMAYCKYLDDEAKLITAFGSNLL